MMLEQYSIHLNMKLDRYIGDRLKTVIGLIDGIEFVSNSAKAHQNNVIKYM